MSDPIERMNQLRDEVERAPMLSAAAVRRRGDRLRRRRTAAVTAGAALAVAAVVVPVTLLTTGDPGSRGPVDPAGPSPSSTSSPEDPTTTLTERNLLGTSDVSGAWGDGIDVSVARTSPGAVTVSPCREGWGSSGAIDTLSRTFGFSAVEGGDGDADHRASQTVAAFSDTATAARAYEQAKAWIDDCTPRGADQVATGTWTAVAVPVAGRAELGGLSYGPADAAPGSAYDVSGRDDLGWVLTRGLVVSGNRVAVITDLTLVTGAGGDTSAPIRSLLPAAAERLASGPATGDEPARTDIPAGFPLDRDLSAPEGDPVSGPGPTARGINPIDVCGEDDAVGAAQWPAAFEDRLAASAPGPASYLDARELITLPDSSAAADVLEEIRAQVAACGAPRDGVVWTEHDAPTLGEESLVITRTFELGLGGDIHQLTRVGNAILAVDRGGEWELSSTVPAGIEEVGTVSASLVEEMCVFTDGGC